MHNKMTVPLHKAIEIAAEALSQLRQGNSSEDILRNLNVSDEYLEAVLMTLWSH